MFQNARLLIVSIFIMITYSAYGFENNVMMGLDSVLITYLYPKVNRLGIKEIRIKNDSIIFSSNSNFGFKKVKIVTEERITQKACFNYIFMSASVTERNDSEMIVSISQFYVSRKSDIALSNEQWVFTIKRYEDKVFVYNSYGLTPSLIGILKRSD